jgi:hypothetical protein
MMPGHARIHPGARAWLEHGDQVRQRGKRGSDAGAEPDDLGPLKRGDDQAGRVIQAALLTAREYDRTAAATRRVSS